MTMCVQVWCGVVVCMNDGGGSGVATQRTLGSSLMRRCGRPPDTQFNSTQLTITSQLSS